MSRLAPFRALRPDPAVAPRVSSVPYDVVSTEEARALAAGDPLSFLHVTRSEIDLPAAVSPYSDEAYALARANLEALRSRAPLVVEDAPALYLYRQRMGEHVQTGVAGTFSVEEYERDAIKKHEKTRRDKEDDRTRHILELRAQTGVVFLTYRARPQIDRRVARAVAAPPLYRFTSADGVEHTVWRLQEEDRDALVADFAALPALYIADGHHRAASAWRARNEIAAGRALRPPGPGAGDSGTFLAVAFPHDQARILPYHRVVADLHGRSAAELRAELAARFRTVDGPQPPARQGEVGVYLGGIWSTIVLPAPADGESPVAGLDCNRLEQQVLAPLLGIGDLRTDKRIDFVGGIRGTAELERRVDSGRAAVAFALHPVTVEDLFRVADAGEIMPPKSTWFEPKLRDGLLIHEI
ncbi:MAG: DUF1015 family protein [Thermoanaerobaculia bacterium]